MNRETKWRKHLRSVLQYAEILYILTYHDILNRYNDEDKAIKYARYVVNKIEQIETRNYKF